MYKDKPSYYAIIPANVRYDKRLTDKAKLLYGEITCLTNKTGECWASNQYFADLYEVSKQTISNTISVLIKYGYITSELIYKEGYIIDNNGTLAGTKKQVLEWINKLNVN